METSTTDMQLSGYLLATGHRLLRVEEARRRKVLVFEACDAAVREFYNGPATVSARALFDGYFRVKAAVFGNHD